MNKVFDALASDTRRKILSLLSADSMSAGDIAACFDMSKPAISKHLQILENAGLVTSEKRGQFVWYSSTHEPLNAAIAHFLQSVAPQTPAEGPTARTAIPPRPGPDRPRDARR